MLKIKRGAKSFYVGDSEESPLAEMTFLLTGRHLITIDHTYISDELKGQGVGKQLLSELVDWAREENKKIIPLCSYAKAQMEKHSDYHDMLANNPDQYLSKDGLDKQ